MDVNGVANAANQAAASVAGSAGYTTNQQTEVTGNETAAAKDNTAVVYEKSDLSKAKESAKNREVPMVQPMHLPVISGRSLQQAVTRSIRRL